MPGQVATEPLVVAHLLTDAWSAELGDHIVSAQWSPDGTRFATAFIGGPITIFTAEGDVVHRLSGHEHGTHCISWSADGRFLASGGQDGVGRIWDAASGRRHASLDAGASWVERVAFSPRKDFLLTAAGRTLRLWNSGGEMLREYPRFASTIADIQWQRDDLFFAAAGYGQVVTHGVETASDKAFAWKGSILAIAWSPDANFIATGNQDATVHFWYRKSGRDLEMSGYPAKIRELSWDATSRYLATGGSPTVMIWDCAGKGPAGTRPTLLEGHNALLSALMFDPKGVFLASGCQGGRVYVWNHRAVPERPLRGSELGSAVTQLRWSPDGARLAATSADGLVCVYRRPEKDR